MYPSGHPILRLPQFFANIDANPGYEDLIRLAELFGGPHVKPTATSEDIEKSALRIVDAAELPELEAKGEVMSNTTERCLICLSEYEAGEDVRLMSCRHAFHQCAFSCSARVRSTDMVVPRPCVDKWLTSGKNNCPTCRTVGVTKEKTDSTLSDDLINANVSPSTVA